MYGPEQRRLLETESTALYEALVREGAIPLDDPRVAVDGPGGEAFALLVELGLAQRDAEGVRWVPADPAGLQTRVVTPLSSEGTRLLEESTQWSQTLASLGQTYRRAPAQPGGDSVTYLRDTAINAHLSGLVADVEDEILTAQPQTGRDAVALAAAAVRDTAAIDRGVRFRTLYQHAARRHTPTVKYVDVVTARGAQVRTLDEFFNRLIVLDRRIAIIPGSDDLSTAVVVREPAVVAYLVDVFERAWERGRPFGQKDGETMRDIAAEQRAMTIRMLVEGHADPTSAKRLGVSPRTYAGYIADLKAEYDAETRFQLGYEMGRLGVTGDETSADD
ncbi:LuxR family transcriptional regulator [Nocardioides sp. TRM66260-LWL]|uniref:LuxR family transcriptional regulator n=1 Tax=Nocardioides sp. TRM66260-LWL TaxID=2874478 RepID=UPI001CC52276|nr:LuxR family transcriptional regulator [Nocardioides sp. TRM66260-LWL]MBZ5735429.1 LuxR family transcriptional regulator [Nocardioides sp. TRM66260-LWL]